MFWQSVAGQVLVGILANLLFVLVLTAIGVVYVRAVLTRRSRPLRRLLGVGGRLPGSYLAASVTSAPETKALGMSKLSIQIRPGSRSPAAPV